MDKPSNCLVIPRAVFDNFARDGAFTIGPFISSFGDGPGEPYIPPGKRDVWGRLGRYGENVSAGATGTAPEEMSDKNKAALNNDVSMDVEARALRRVVRAMHDGNCPNCGIIVASSEMINPRFHGWQCPQCGFTISKDEADAALRLFQPFMLANLEVFKRWQLDFQTKLRESLTKPRQPD